MRALVLRMIEENISNIRKNIIAVCNRAKRPVSDITFIAVTKQRSIEEIKRVIDCGTNDIGENRVQEAALKYAQLGRRGNIVWHMVGHLQRNKAKDAVRIFDVIHSVDSLSLAQEINRQAKKMGKVQPILLQVNVAREESKYGVYEEDLARMVAEIESRPNLRLDGLMVIAPLAADKEGPRPYFRRLRMLSGQFTFSSPRPALSMGMTQDYETAIEEGATLLRIGRGIFG